jgi:hypothetical protein
VQLLTLAVKTNVSVEMMQGLQALHERVSDRNARMMFFDALARFQDLCPPIGYSRKVEYANKDGQGTKYGYAELPHIARSIAPYLKQVGLSYGWDAEVKGDALVTTCTLRHIDGHSEKSSFTVPTGSAAGMSPAQKFGAAGTYGRRQSLIQVLGLTTCEPDTDGAVEEPVDPKPITEDQVRDLEALLAEAGRKVETFVKWAKIKKLADLPAARYDTVCQDIRGFIETKLREAKAGKGGA